MEHFDRTPMNPSLAVIGVGNPYRGDDGVGIYLMQHIKENNFFSPSVVECIDGGTGGLNLFHIISSYQKVLIVDAVYCQKQTGAYVFFSSDEITSSNKIRSSVSTHGSDLFQVIQQVKKFNDDPPEIYIFGVQPEDVSLKNGFSHDLKRNLPMLIAELKQRIADLINRQ